MPRRPAEEVFVIVPARADIPPMSALLLGRVVPVLDGLKKEGLLAGWLYNYKTTQVAGERGLSHLLIIRPRWRSENAEPRGREALLAALSGRLEDGPFHAASWPSFWDVKTREAGARSLEKRFGGAAGARLYGLFGAADTELCVAIMRALESGRARCGSIGAALAVLYAHMNALGVAPARRAAFLERSSESLLSPPLAPDEARARVEAFRAQAAQQLEGGAPLRAFVNALSEGSPGWDPALEPLLARSAPRMRRIGKALRGYAGRGGPGVPDAEFQAAVYIQMHFTRRFLGSHKGQLVRALAWAHERGRAA